MTNNIRIKYKRSSSQDLTWDSVAILGPTTLKGYLGGTHRGYDVQLDINEDGLDDIIRRHHNWDKDWREQEITRQFEQLENSERATVILDLMANHQKLES